jgi:hypothetical protein
MDGVINEWAKHPAFTHKYLNIQIIEEMFQVILQ